MSPGQIKEQQLRDGGYTDDQLAQWRGQAAQDLQTGGYSAMQIRDYFGQKEPDMAATHAVVKQNLAAYQIYSSLQR